MVNIPNKISAKDFRDLIESGDLSVGKKGIESTGGRKPVKEKRSAPAPIVELPKPVIENMRLISLEKGYFFIPYAVTSSKNSKDLSAYLDKEGSPRIRVRESEACRIYRALSTQHWQKQRDAFKKEFDKVKQRPVAIGFVWVMKTHQKFDFHNMEQLPFDIMQEQGWISDDDYSTVKGIPLGTFVDKELYGLFIRILPEESGSTKQEHDIRHLINIGKQG